MQPSAPVTGHLVWGTCGNVESLSCRVAALVTIDDRYHGAFEHLEMLILLRVEVLRRKSSAELSPLGASRSLRGLGPLMGSGCGGDVARVGAPGHPQEHSSGGQRDEHDQERDLEAGRRLV